MNLPTREEAKEICDKVWKKHKLEDGVEILLLLDIAKAYASGSLIEARTEGEIEKVILENGYDIGGCGIGINSEELAHALVGKV